YGEVEDYTVTVATATSGACCATSGACSLTESNGCAGGIFQGIGQGCNPINPCGGACCHTSGGFTVTTAATCPNTSLFHNHGVCTSTSCIFCAAGADSCNLPNPDERISHVTFNTIDNESGNGAGPAGCYTNFTSISTNVTPGQSYAIIVSNAFNYAGDQAAVW